MHWSHQSRLQSQNSHQWRTPKICAQGKSVGNCEDEETETSQNVALGTIDFGSFEVSSDHGDDMDGDESTFETTEMMPPLPLDSWFRGQRRFSGSFGNLAMKITETKRIHSLIVGMGGKNSSTLCSKVCPRLERVLLSELPCLYCVPEAGSVPTSATFFRDSMTYPVNEKTDRATTPMMETRWT